MSAPAKLIEEREHCVLQSVYRDNLFLVALFWFDKHMAALPASNDRIVPLSSKLAFGIGQYAEGLKNTAFSLFILFYYNQVLGLSGTLAGAALFIALLFDAITDPLAGSLSDNFKSRLGRRHPFMHLSADTYRRFEGAPGHGRVCE